MYKQTYNIICFEEDALHIDDIKRNSITPVDIY